jgi:hypothetical protein
MTVSLYQKEAEDFLVAHLVPETHTETPDPPADKTEVLEDKKFFTKSPQTCGDFLI